MLKNKLLNSVWGRAMIIAISLLLSITGIAYAITITVDGVRESAWDGGGSVSDDGGNEGTIRDGNDIDRVEFTNSTSYYFILLDTFANTIWDNPFGQDPSLYICINTDNAATGASGVAQCDNGNMTGVDFILEFIGGPSITFNIYDSSFNPVNDPDKQIAFANDINEIRVSVSAIGLGIGNCLTTMPTSIYFDNGVGDPEDYTPNNGTTDLGCGVPTAITLENLSAHSNNSTVLVGLVAALFFVAGAWYLFRRAPKSQA
ncbi:MAG TPA: hypothetical protein VI451_17910 [Anaerolineales bacterium]|nr:hypothetical protein [Anaerolineales bacterium]